MGTYTQHFKTAIPAGAWLIVWHKGNELVRTQSMSDALEAQSRLAGPDPSMIYVVHRDIPDGPKLYSLRVQR